MLCGLVVSHPFNIEPTLSGQEVFMDDGLLHELHFRPKLITRFTCSQKQGDGASPREATGVSRGKRLLGDAPKASWVR